LIYVIDVMTEKNVVWGVGRGSSCSSYLLYLLGLHEVDPVKYEIEISDFLR
jgi:DNA polymerase III alpha subunit